MTLSHQAADIFTTRLLEGHIGQGMDLHWTNQTKVPTEDEYFTMIDGSKFNQLPHQHSPLARILIATLYQKPAVCLFLWPS